MDIRRLVAKEILHRKVNYALSVIATLMAAASLIGAIVLLREHDARTSLILSKKEAELEVRMDRLQDDTRKAMLKLGFNLVILPEDQNLAQWHADDYSTTYMPESYADRLAASDIMTVRHILPSLQQKILWSERRKTIILMGTRGEVPNIHLSPKQPLVQPVPQGSLILGFELHRSMDIKVGDEVLLLGRKFAVKKCYSQRGNKDDITAWINLKDAQELLNKKGWINAILALECLCVDGNIDAVRKEVASILPETQVIERESLAVAREEARKQVAGEAAMTLEKEEEGKETLREERERMASILVPVILLVCALWVAIMGFVNVRSRREEIGILRAVGVSSRRIFMLFIWKHISIGILGGISGLLLGILFALFRTGSDESVSLGAVGSLAFWFGMAALAIIGASFLAVIAGWIPAMIAANQDPAEVLREE